MNPLRKNEIWLLLDSRIYGGIESHVLQLASGLRAQIAVRVMLLQSYPDSQEMINRLKAQQIPYTVLCDYYPHDKPATALKLAVRRFRPAVVHAHGYKASLLSKFIRRTSRVPFRQISTFHAGEVPAGRVRFYDLLDRLTAFMSDMNFAVSQRIRRRIPFAAEKINNFVDTGQLSLSQGKKIAFVGRLSFEKGPDYLPELSRLLPETQIHCYGDGPMFSQLENAGQQNLILHGHQTSMEPHWPEIGLLVICSRAEGLPMAALEAMARGIPVAATSVGELPSLIHHGRNGYLVKQVRQLVDCIRSWSSLSGEQRQTMQQQARETIVRHYSHQAIIPEIMVKYLIPGQPEDA